MIDPGAAEDILASAFRAFARKHTIVRSGRRRRRIEFPITGHRKVESIIACKTCGCCSVSRPETGHCGRVFPLRLSSQPGDSLGRTAAFSLAALIFFVPATSIRFYSWISTGRIRKHRLDGCVTLYQDGQWPVATIVFLASIVVPLLKLLGLFFLVVVTKFRPTFWRTERTWIYKVIDVIGPWAMLDVFLLSILVAW